MIDVHVQASQHKEKGAQHEDNADDANKVFDAEGYLTLRELILLQLQIDRHSLVSMFGLIVYVRSSDSFFKDLFSVPEEVRLVCTKLVCSTFN